MSELKAFNMPRYAGQFTLHEVYLKSEADKVIARHKYKRCLAMARWCDAEVYHIRRTPLCDMSEHEYWKYENDFWQRWQKRWLELAEKFKPNKSTAQKGKGNKMEMVETKNDLLTTKYTKVLEEAEYKYNAPHTFKVIKAEEETSEEHKGENLVLAEIHFQEGPIKECGVNGVMNEDLLVMVIRRLEGFQNSEFKCRENACAITKLEEALLWLCKRTMGRENRGVEGTHKV